MPTNLHAAVRYNVIDHLLRLGTPPVTWQKIAEACSAKFELLGHDKKVPSKRTIMADISNMRSGKLGYEAPINYSKDLGYYYSDKKFSIYRLNIPGYVLDELRQVLLTMDSLLSREYFPSIYNTIDVLEDALNISAKPSTSRIIYLEESLNKDGQKWLDAIYNYIKRKIAIQISYKPFDDTYKVHYLSPLIIKEYNNRWYVLGYSFDFDKIINLALDRIQSITPSLKEYYYPDTFDPRTYFEHLYGVTKLDKTPVYEWIIKVSESAADYWSTKPLHPTQKYLYAEEDAKVFSLTVYDNYEIKSVLNSFGDQVQIISKSPVNYPSNKT